MGDIKYTCGAGTPEEAEANCTSFIDGECTASFCEYRRKKQTNADRIRVMNDFELAAFLVKCKEKVCDDRGVERNAYEELSEMLIWLQQPAE